MRQHPHKASKGPGAVTPRFPAERPSTSNCASSPARPHPPSRSAKWMGQKRQRSLDRRGDGLREVGVSTVTGLCAQPGQTLDAWLLPQARRIPSCLRVPGFFRTEPGLFCAIRFPGLGQHLTKLVTPRLVSHISLRHSHISASWNGS